MDEHPHRLSAGDLNQIPVSRCAMLCLLDIRDRACGAWRLLPEHFHVTRLPPLFYPSSAGGAHTRFGTVMVSVPGDVPGRLPH